MPTSIQDVFSGDAELIATISQIKFPWEVLLKDLRAQGHQTITLEYADLSQWGIVAAASNFTHHTDDIPVNEWPENAPKPLPEDEIDEALEKLGGHIMWGDRIPGLPDELQPKAGVAGLAWSSGKIQVEQSYRGTQTAAWIVSAEIAHMADFFYMKSRGLEPAIMRLMGLDPAGSVTWWSVGGNETYWEQPGEGWMAAFGIAYTDFVKEDTRFKYRLSAARAAEIRQTLGLARTDQGGGTTPASETITSYARADGSASNDFAGGAPCQLLGSFVIDANERRISYGGLTFNNLTVTPAKITATVPVFQDADHIDGHAVMVHNGQTVTGPPLTIRKQQVQPPPPPPPPGGNNPVPAVTIVQDIAGARFSGSVTIQPAAPLPDQTVIEVTIRLPDGRSGSTSTKISGNPPPPPSLAVNALTIYPASIAAGAQATGTVSLAGSAPAAGVEIALSVAGPAIVPAKVLIGAGLTSANFPIAAGSVAASTVITVTASLGASTRTANLTVHPAPAGVSPLIESITPTSGDRLTPVTLKGQRFGTRAGRVVFTRIANPQPGEDGGIAAAILSWKDAEIKVTVPASAITGSVYVRSFEITDAAKQKSNSVSFTVTNLPGGGGGGGTGGGGIGTIPLLFVSPAGSDTADGSRERPWKTLAKAVDAARDAPRGTVIQVAAGTYVEMLSFVSGISWKGDGWPVIDGKGRGGIGIVGANVTDAAIVGFVIQNWANLGSVQGGQRVKLSGCKLFDGKTSGFWMNRSSDCEITKNEIARCGTGKGDDCFAFEDCARILVSDNDVSKAAHAGIQFLVAKECRILRNNVHNCGSSGIIAKRGFDDGEIAENFVKHSAWSDESSEGRRDAGIQLVGSRTKVRRNRVLHCGGGIILSLHSDASIVSNENLIEENTVYDSQEAGIDLSGYGNRGDNSALMTGNVIRRNIAWRSGSADLRLQFSGGREFWGNGFDQNVAGIVQAYDGRVPSVETGDPRLDPETLASAFYHDRGWQP